MAKNTPSQEPKGDSERAAPLPTFSEQDKAKARAWFKKADAERERRAYDFAIECYIQGLTFWPEAVDEGHKPLWALAIQRQQVGGKKPGMLETLKYPTGGKDARQALLNSALLLAKDPTNAGHYDAVVKNASRAAMFETLRFYSPKALDSMRKEKKPTLSRFRSFKQYLVEAAEKADAAGKPQIAALFFEEALHGVEFLMSRNSTDMGLRDEQRDLSGRLTITKGKYGDAESFRDSLQDAESQKLLHDTDRVKQGEQTLKELLSAARAEWRADPQSPARINTLVDTLLKTERRGEEDEALEVLEAAFKTTSNYRFRLRADDLRLQRLQRQRRALREKAAASKSEDDNQQYRLALSEERQTTVEIYRQRVAEYPTDLAMKYKLGAALYELGELDEAIPLLQMAQADPRSRFRSQMLIGKAFHQKGTHSQAIEVLREALEAYAGGADDLAKELLFTLGTAQVAEGRVADAKATLGKLLRIDYNYGSGKARELLEGLK